MNKPLSAGSGLDALAAEAAALEQGKAGPAPGAAPGGDGGSDLPPVVTVGDAEKWAKYPLLFGMLICKAMPELQAAYTMENCLQWGKAMVPIASRMGWKPDGVLGEWGTLASASAVFVVPTVQAVRARRAAMLSPAPGADGGTAPDAGAPGGQ